jgi:hypothetical protein
MSQLIEVASRREHCVCGPLQKLSTIAAIPVKYPIGFQILRHDWRGDGILSLCEPNHSGTTMAVVGVDSELYNSGQWRRGGAIET